MTHVFYIVCMYTIYESMCVCVCVCVCVSELKKKISYDKTSTPYHAVVQHTGVDANANLM